ncbi:DNA/RNA polymerase [Schizophyllum commune H4-8]|uniref:DNA/RNA polymerase n=1 Tax=Schizophyllum commune (strain H4-8 / FGSC 9210) TaxID=578458 RepID=UPI00216002A5|nr:DNA/RNA polymerase [Schizophyllum commune H4-8]KAI5890539.1 DNA/RNA polymerase [Schizophyllum commune H4-8]
MGMQQPSQQTDSLVKRLAGPSTGKAGLAKDQTEINRIIAEASKGSKFYDNEKKKDKDLTQRIEKILAVRDEALRGADIGAIEATVDHILAELESERDLSQYIVHVDMDAFFANVEMLYQPEVKGKAFGVGMGVLTTASYEARQYGVRSGMPTFIAKKLCPDLILVKINHERYSEKSKQVMDIFRRYDPTMCPASCDEGYLNITKYCREHDIGPEECVAEMRRVVHEESDLTVSAGIAPNKMLAKICSDKNKPNGQFYLPFDRSSIMSFMRDLSIRKIPGVGRVNERLLESIGIKTCGDIYTHRATVYLMDKHFGMRFLLQTYLGIASNTVRPPERQERKSIGAERRVTFNPISEKDKIMLKLDEVAAELEDDMRTSGWAGRTVTLKFKLDTYQVFTRAKSFDRWITSKEDLYAAGKELLAPEWPLILRLIGLRVTKLKDLRAPEPSGGIKRFFGAPSHSPTKRRKLSAESDMGAYAKSEGMASAPITVDDLDEAMPGFHEEEENEPDLSQHDDIASLSQHDDNAGVSAADFGLEGDGENDAERSTSSNKPVFAAQSSKPISYTAARSSSTKPSSKPPSKPPRSPSPTEEQHDCPICGKTLAADNDGLNQHIDWCLSRGAILEAQRQSSRTTQLHQAAGAAVGSKAPNSNARTKFQPRR